MRHDPWMMRCKRAWRALGWLSALAAAACTQTTTPVNRGLVSGRTLALACLQNGQIVDDLACTSDANLRALVGGGSKGTIALAAPSDPRWIDQSSAVPGNTPLRIPGPPVALAVDATSGQAFAAIGAGAAAQVARVALTKLASGNMQLVDGAPIDFEPTDLAIIQRAGQSWLVVTDPDRGQLAATPVAAFGPTPVWSKWQVPGTPFSLAWMPGRKQLWVGHLHQGYVSVVDVETGQLVGTPISIDAACRDGLDNDGDGKVDGGDAGCDAPDDRSELDAEVGSSLCGNGLDDDADGATDQDDAGCQQAPAGPVGGVVDGCRDGIDEDGDGLTDYPDDPGCSGHADTTEASDQATCADGVDDDGDGKTDLADTDCDGKPQGQEWPDPIAPGGVWQGPCGNGVDDDGDGLTDLGDPGCFDRAGGTEAGADWAPAAKIAASFDGRWVAVGHQARRELAVIDAESRHLLQPQRGDTAPFLRTSRLDERDGVVGLAMVAPVTAIAPAIFNAHQAFAAATTPGGMFTVRPTGDDDAAASVRFVLAASQTATAVAKPALLIGDAAVDLGASVPTRYASLGPLRVTSTATGTNYYGIQPTTESYEHRTEQWRATYQGLLPGAQRGSGQWRGAGVLHDPQADFCRIGVVPGDLVILAPASATGCPSAPIAAPVLAVYADSLQLDAGAAHADEVLTAETQLQTDLAAAAPSATVALPGPGCFATGQVQYSVRAAGWLLTGSRTGLLSSRPSRDGACAALPADELTGARLPEPKLRASADGKPVRPATCPYVGDTFANAFVASPVNTPMFAGLQIQPGCLNQSDATGKPVVRVLGSLRGATWVFNVVAGFQPRVTGVGSAPAGIVSGPHLQRAYVVDSGSASLSIVELATGGLLAMLQ